MTYVVLFHVHVGGVLETPARYVRTCVEALVLPFLPDVWRTLKKKGGGGGGGAAVNLRAASAEIS